MKWWKFLLIFLLVWECAAATMVLIGVGYFWKPPVPEMIDFGEIMAVAPALLLLIFFASMEDYSFRISDSEETNPRKSSRRGKR